MTLMGSLEPSMMKYAPESNEAESNTLKLPVFLHGEKLEAGELTMIAVIAPKGDVAAPGSICTYSFVDAIELASSRKN